MRLTQASFENFRCFDQKSFTFHPNFNLIIGANGTGKTTILDALSIAISTWFLGFDDISKGNNIALHDARLAYNDEFITNWPVSIHTSATINQQNIEWSRQKKTKNGKTLYGNAKHLIKKIQSYDESLRKSGLLPILCYFGTARLLNSAQTINAPDKLANQRKLTRLSGYEDSLNPKISSNEMMLWFARQAWATFQSGKTSAVLNIVTKAILACIEDAEKLYFDPNRGELILKLKNQTPTPFNYLSDGQRCVLAMVADIAQRAVTLNPNLGENTLCLVEGVVLIDELDLHLHPKWQRRVIEDLRATFPKIQFICTSHSPFLIQSLRSGDELIMLDGQPFESLENKPLEDIANSIMGVSSPEVSARYQAMKNSAIDYLTKLENAPLKPEEKLEEFTQQLAEDIAPYADNPAYQAVLELERISKLGR